MIDGVISAQGPFREWMNGYLFIIDVFAICVLCVYMVSAYLDEVQYHSGSLWKKFWKTMRQLRTNGAPLAFALTLYLIGHTINRFWLWQWWIKETDQPNVWNDLSSLLHDPQLLISTVFITAGLMCLLRVLAGSMIGAWWWAGAIIVAAVVPAILS